MRSMATPPHHCKEIKLHRGQLDLDSPLLSTRRSSTSIDAESSLRELSAQTTMIPFSWESSPGVPKDAVAANATDRTSPPPPNPPPARWRPSSEIHCTTNNHDRCNARDDDDDVFSDAVEKISLSENLNIACRLSSFDGVASKDIEEMVNRSRPRPSYIMERFLPAANAIANSLALNQHNKGCSTRRADHHHSSCTQCARKELALQHIMHQRRKRRSSSTVESKPQQPPFFSHLEDENELSTRACGVMLFFPWSLRPIVCGFKSPPRSTTPNGSNNIINSLFTPRSMRGVSSELHLDNDEGTNYSGSFDIDKKSSVRECYSPGWGLGLSFFDRRRKAMRCVLERERENGSEKSKKDRKDVSKCKEGNWRMPQLKTPSEPWLSHALNSTLNSINKRN